MKCTKEGTERNFNTLAYLIDSFYLFHQSISWNISNFSCKKMQPNVRCSTFFQSKLHHSLIYQTKLSTADAKVFFKPLNLRKDRGDEVFEQITCWTWVTWSWKIIKINVNYIEAIYTQLVVVVLLFVLKTVRFSWKVNRCVSGVYMDSFFLA